MTKKEENQEENKKGNKEELEHRIKQLEHELVYFRKENKSLIGQRLDEQKLVDQFKDSLIRLKPEQPYVTKKINFSQHSEQEIVLLFSDCQIGEKIERDETPFGEYNSEIFKRRLNLLYDGVVGITERHRKDTRINKLNIFMLGDIVDGEKIFRGQSARVDSNVVDQFFTGAESIANFLHSLEKHYSKRKTK